MRRNLVALFLIAIAVNVGMWFERFVIIALSVMHDVLPSTWGHYAFTGFDWMILAGSFGLFFTMILVFVRVAPVVSIAELKALLLRRSHRKEEADHG